MSTVTKPTEQVTINAERRLYVIPEGGGYSCLGFDVCEARIARYMNALREYIGSYTERRLSLTDTLVRLLNAKDDTAGMHTVARYELYVEIMDFMRLLKHRFDCDLTPQLIGLEHQRVEVIDNCGDTRRFYVGKSTGFIPCHLEIARSNSTGGIAVFNAPFKSVRIIR